MSIQRCKITKMRHKVHLKRYKVKTMTHRKYPNCHSKLDSKSKRDDMYIYSKRVVVKRWKVLLQKGEKPTKKMTMT